MLKFRIQGTPNPNARKYIVNFMLKSEGKISYRTPEECQHVPMATALLSMEGVTQVHFFENCVTVTQDGSLRWSELDQKVQHMVADHLDAHDENFVDHNAVKQPPRELPPELQAIDEILERTIRPSLQMDGGDVGPLALENNILTVRYMGACGGCPSSMTATLDAMQQILRDEFDEKLEIVAI